MFLDERVSADQRAASVKGSLSLQGYATFQSAVSSSFTSYAHSRVSQRRQERLVSTNCVVSLKHHKCLLNSAGMGRQRRETEDWQESNHPGAAIGWPCAWYYEKRRSLFYQPNAAQTKLRSHKYQACCCVDNRGESKITTAKRSKKMSIEILRQRRARQCSSSIGRKRERKRVL